MTSIPFKTILTIIMFALSSGNIFAMTNSGENHSPKKTATTTLKGDVNSDGQIDISDVLCTVDYILGKHVEQFNVDLADLNNDHTIDISDVLIIVDIILGKNVSDPDNPSLPIDDLEGGDPGTGV